jgi:hypothetical protein
MTRRSNPFPGSRLKKLRTADDYARAQSLLDEIDGKSAEREACAQTAEAMAVHPHDRITAQAIAANIRARKD